MDWYAMVWKKYAEFDGRSRRTEYWMFTLLNFLAMIGLVILGGIGIAISGNRGQILLFPFFFISWPLLFQILPSLYVASTTPEKVAGCCCCLPCSASYRS